MILVDMCEIGDGTRLLVPVLVVPHNKLSQSNVSIDELIGLSDSNIEDFSIHPLFFTGKLSLYHGINGVAPHMGTVGVVFVSDSYPGCG